MLSLKDHLRKNPASTRAEWVDAFLADSRDRMLRVAAELVKSDHSEIAERCVSVLASATARHEANWVWRERERLIAELLIDELLIAERLIAELLIDKHQNEGKI